MTATFDRISTILANLRKRELDKAQTRLVGIALYSAIVDIIDHMENCDRKLVSDFTVEYFSWVYESDRKAFFRKVGRLEKPVDIDKWIMERYCLSIAKGIAEFPNYVSEEGLDCLAKFFSDAHSHDHHPECHLQMIGRTTDFILRLVGR